MVIRNAFEADVPAIQSIYAHYVLNSLATFEEAPPAVEEITRRRAAVLEAGLPWLVAEVEGTVAGYAYAMLYRPRSAYRFTIEDSVYVAAGAGGRGIGGALLREMIERCESGPWRQMIAVIGDSGNAASIALHERFGFRMVGTFVSVGFKFSRWVDTVLMQRPLGGDSEGR
jgi:phosphinothricin acetyltransferase